MTSPKIEGLRWGQWDVLYPQELDEIQLAYQGAGWTEDVLYELAGRVDATVRKRRSITSDGYEWLIIFFYGHGRNMAVLLPKISQEGEECERHVGVIGFTIEGGLELLVKYGKILAENKPQTVPEKV